MDDAKTVSQPGGPDGGSATAPAGIPPDRVLAAGTPIGAFVVEGELGRGSTAVVLAAYDPALDRRVAIKLLHAHAGGDAERHARFLRESRALAKLRHPNVTTVYQAGTFGERVFMAMELVEGETLGAWLARTRPAAPAILAAFVLAGRGLAAAHHAGLVHRDFKPENVLRDREGRIQVTDFGLVGAEAPGAAPDATRGAGALTETGDVLGTPRYMSPEQHAGRPADARADQFSFAVALYEALHGCLPFPGGDLDELRANVLAGHLRASTRPAGAPRRAERALQRALAVNPAVRFPSMDVLLARLERRPAVTAARILLVAGLAAAAGVALVTITPAQPDVCGGAEPEIAEVWNRPHREAILAAFLATGRPHAVATFQRTDAALDDYARAWIGMRTEACTATAVRHEQSAAVRDLRMACLDDRRRGFAALTHLLAERPGPELVDGAIRAAQGLEGLAGCADTAALLTPVPAPAPALAPRVTELRAKLREAELLLAAGEHKEARERLGALAVDARAAGYGPLVARVLGTLGQVQAELREPDARATLDEAMALAADAKDDTGVARALAALMYVLAVDEVRPAEALALRPAMEAAARRAGNDPRLQALLHQNIGAALSVQGELGAAAAELELALALREKISGGDDLEVVRIQVALANTLVKDRRQVEARARLTSALARSVQAVGPSHPDVAGIYTQLGLIAYNAQELDEARAAFDHALAILRTSVGEDSELTGAAHHNIGMVLDEQGRLDDALVSYRLALEIREKVLGREHPAVAATLMNIGIALIGKGDLRGARPYLERAVAIREKAFGPDHPNLATPLLNLGNLTADLGDLDAALPYLERALAIRRKALRAGHPDIARALTELGGLHTSRGHSEAAIPLFEEALGILGDAPDNAAQVAKTRFGLAQALWHSGCEPVRATRLAAEARVGFVAHEMASWATQVDQWTQRREHVACVQRSRRPR
jgi:serine/threonine-protein kinase